MEDTEQTENLSFPTHHLHNPEDLDSSSHHCPKRQKKNKSQNTTKAKKYNGQTWSLCIPIKYTQETSQPITCFNRLPFNQPIFSFSNTYWIQLSGTAMGTPAACSYATITYGHFENTEILMEFHPQILFYRRYIDDIFGLWVPPSTQQASTWTRFKEKLNSWGNLKWLIEEPSNKTVFLDLQVELRPFIPAPIKRSSTFTCTYHRNLLTRQAA